MFFRIELWYSFFGEENRIRFEQWRTDRASQKELNEALERAARRLVERFDLPEAQALIQDRYFYEREQVKAAIRELAAHPFDQDAVKTVECVLSSVMPDHSDGQQADAARFFLQCLLEELCSVKKLHEVLSLIYQQKSLELEAKQVETGQKILDTLEHRLPVPPDIQTAQRQYLDYVVNLNCTLGSQGIMQTARSVTLPLDEVFVRLTCEKEEPDPAQLKRKVDKLKSEIREDKPPSEFSIMASAESDLTENWFLPAHMQIAEHSDGIELPSTITNHSHIVILGDPGSGKTTLLRFLALHFAREFRDRGPTGIVTDKDGQIYGPARFPIFVRISAYAEALRLNRNTSFREFLTIPFGDIEIGSNELNQVFKMFLQEGLTLLLLDGLDEVIEPTDQFLIAERIESFARAIPSSNRFVVTSRIAGYQAAKLSGNFRQFTLRKFEYPQIEAFLTKWCLAVEQFHTPDAPKSDLTRQARRELYNILQAIRENRGVRELASNPLLLTILALIHRNGSRLPSRRVELYDLAVKTLLETWPLSKGIDIRKIFKEDVLRLLKTLAFWLHSEKPTGLVKTIELKTQLAKYLGDLRNQPPESIGIEAAVDSFLQGVRVHTGVLTEKAPNEYGFLHQTFQEYLTAGEIYRWIAKADETISHFRLRQRWREPIRLAIGYFSNNQAEYACELIQTAILGQGVKAQEKGFTSSQFEDVLHRDLLLAVQCLGDCSSTEVRIRQEVLAKFTKVYFESTNSQFEKRVERILEKLKGSDLEDELVQIALTNLEHKNEIRRIKAIQILGKLAISNRDVIAQLVAKLTDKHPRVREQAIEKLMRVADDYSEIVPLFLNLLVDKDAQVRISSIRMVSLLWEEFPIVTSKLVERLNDKDGLVRFCTVLELSQIAEKSPDVLDHLLRVLEDTANVGEVAVLAVSLCPIGKKA